MSSEDALNNHFRKSDVAFNGFVDDGVSGSSASDCFRLELGVGFATWSLGAVTNVDTDELECDCTSSVIVYDDVLVEVVYSDVSGGDSGISSRGVGEMASPSGYVTGTKRKLSSAGWIS